MTKVDVINMVDPSLLVEKVAEKLKEKDEFKPPEFIYFVKSGAHAERKPVDPEKFWYLRCASILRRAFVEGTIGVGRLATYYGGRKNRGTEPEKHVDAGRAIIRKAIQALEKAGYLRKVKRKGRRISYEGYVLLNKTACEILGVECELDESKYSRRNKQQTNTKPRKDTTRTSKKTNRRTTKTRKVKSTEVSN